MMNLIPFLFVLIFGFLLFCIFYKRTPSKNSPLEWIIAFWLGMSLCVIIVFCSFIFLNQYDAAMIKLVSIFAIFILLGVYCLRFDRSDSSMAGAVKITDWLQFGILGTLAWFLMSMLSSHNPYGDWDAWSFWNFRSRYLLSAGVYWKDLLTHVSQARHPWFLPFWTAFGWTWTGESDVFPRLSSQVFSVIVLATVFFGILELGGRRMAAFLGGLFLISMPIFIVRSVSQYADGVLAGLIAINMLLLLRIYKQFILKDMMIFGVLLGQMAFVKDEGIACALIFLILLFFIKIPKKRFYSLFFMMLIASSIPVIIMKYWMWSVPGESLSWGNVFNIERWKTVLNYFCKELTLPMFGSLVGLFIITISLWICGRWNNASLLMGIFLLMFISFFSLLYVLVSSNLMWKLSVTSTRLVYQILPIFIILLFHNIFLKKQSN